MPMGFIVVYDRGSLNGKPLTVRYIQRPGWKRYRGMYRNRRLVGIERPLLCDDREQAFQFNDRATAKRQILLCGGPTLANRFRIERIKEE